MKKYFIYAAIFGIAVIFGCKKVDNTKPAKLSAGGILDSIIIGNNQSLALTSNVNAIWSINKAAGGTFSANTFTSSNNDGCYIIKAKNLSDLKDSLQFFVIVTKHAAVFNAMKSGGYFMSFRHADASNGSDQLSLPISSNWWKSCDNTLARQMTNPKGYLQSDSTGTALKRLGIRFDSSYTSEYCRCKQTLTGFALTGVPIREVRELTYWVYDETNRYGNTMNFYQTRPITNKNYVAVTHAGFSGNVPTPAPLNTLQWGDASIFKITGAGTPARLDATVLTNDFMLLARD